MRKVPGFLQVEEMALKGHMCVWGEGKNTKNSLEIMKYFVNHVETDLLHTMVEAKRKQFLQQDNDALWNKKKKKTPENQSTTTDFNIKLSDATVLKSFDLASLYFSVFQPFFSVILDACFKLISWFQLQKSQYMHLKVGWCSIKAFAK